MGNKSCVESPTNRVRLTSRHAEASSDEVLSQEDEEGQRNIPSSILSRNIRSFCSSIEDMCREPGGAGPIAGRQRGWEARDPRVSERATAARAELESRRAIVQQASEVAGKVLSARIMLPPLSRRGQLTGRVCRD